MITVTFAANNLFALRDDIVKFLEDAGFETVRKELGFSIEKIDIQDRPTRDLPNPLSEGIKMAVIPPFEVTQPAPLEPAQIVEEQAPIPEETQTEQPTASASSASQPLTFEEVRLATLQLASKRGREAVMAVLEPYNVKRSSEVSEDLWPELIAKLEAAQNV